MSTAVLGAGGQIGRYTVEGVLGEGALAVVYRVRHTDLGTRHALKVLKVPHAIVVDRLLKEGRAQATLQHPNIVAVSDIVDVKGSPGLLMEYVEGTTLKDVLAQNRLTLEQAHAVGRGLLAGVAAAHRAGLIHRDLKPANVLMAIQGKRMIPKITDFGLVKALDGEEGGDLSTRTGIVLGTPQYMAPEQFDDPKSVDRRADVFSVGVMLYELICGQRPYTGKGLLEIVDHARAGSFVPIDERVPGVPEGMKEAIEAALQAEPDERVGNCEVLYRMWTETDSGMDGDPDFQTEIIEKIQLEREASLERSLEELPDPAQGTYTDEESIGPTDEVTHKVRPLGGAPPDDLADREPTAETVHDGDSKPAVVPVWMVAVVALGLVGVGFALIAVGGAGVLAMVTAPSAPETVEVGPSPAPTPEPVEPDQPENPEPGSVEPDPPEPAPDPVAPEPAAPDPVAVTSPAPVEPAVPDPAEPPVPSGPATVTVTGDHTAFSLLAEDGRKLSPGEIEPGTYTIYAAFAEDPMRARGKLKVAPGEQVALRCDGVVRFSCER